MFLQIGLFSLYACSGQPGRSENPKIIGVDPFSLELRAENYNEVLRSWGKKRFKNRTILHVSPYSGLAPVPDDRLRRLKEGIGAAGPSALSEIEVTGHDYLFAAARMGMVKKIYWVIPFSYVDYIDAEARVKQYLNDSVSYFKPEDIDSMRFSDGCVTGELSGIETHICGPSTLPSFDVPVLATVNTGFFPVFASEKKKNILGVMKLFLDSLAFRRIGADSLHIVSQAEELALRGYIHEEISEMLRNPDTTGGAEPPELWRLRDAADNLLAGGGAREVLALLKARGGEYPEDPYLLLMRTTVELLLGMTSEGLEVIEKKCQTEKLFCKGLVDAGVLLKNQGKKSEAAIIFAKALKLNGGDKRARLELDKMKKSPSAVK
ncbi:MAG: hypothetical protein HZB33_16250 [Nitrospirae bacterium]|nr:hypothetical protein [Nitrospirota bacterium]